MPDPRDRFIRHVETPIAPTETGRPRETREVPNARRGFYRPALPEGFKDDSDLGSAHSAVDAMRDDLRRKVDAIWASEPSIPGVSLTPKQRHEMKKAEVKRVVEDELAGRMKLVRPVVDSATKELGKRREALTKKGNVKLTGIDAERAMRIGDHFASLPAERRVLMALEAMNDPTGENRELLQALAWSHPSMELVPADTRARIQGVLIAAGDPDEYSNLTQLDNAISATSESLTNLETWAASLADEY